MPSVIFLSGPIGAGKSTVARALAPLWAGPLAVIDGDRLWPCFVRPDGFSRHENFTILMRAMTASSLPFVRSGYDAVLDFSVPPAFLPIARKIVKDMPLDFVLLRPSAALCATRAGTRPDGPISAYDHDFYALFLGHDRHAVTDDGADAAAIAAQIAAGIGQGRFRVHD